MRYYTVALALLAGLGLVALTEPWPTTDRKTWPIVENCRDDFCDCPAASNALLCNDFEEGETDCAVSRAYGSLNLLGEIGYVVGTPDCADATSPLDGSYSFEGTKVDGSDILSYFPVDTTGSINVCENSVDCVATALLNVKDDTGGVPGIVMSLGGAGQCTMTYGGLANGIRVECTAGDTTVYVATLGVTYKVCLKYEADDDCTVAVDAEDGTWCAGALGSETVLNCDAGTHKEVTNVALHDGGDKATIELDNYMVVAE